MLTDTQKIALLPQDRLDALWVNFNAKVATANPDECWLWQGGKTDRHTYGDYHFQFQNKVYHLKAHRLAYLQEQGVIDNDLLVLHSCDNPACCNPKHLRQGTDQDNSDDRMVRLRWNGGRRRGGCGDVWLKNLGQQALAA